MTTPPSSSRDGGDTGAGAPDQAPEQTSPAGTDNAAAEAAPATPTITEARTRWLSLLVWAGLALAVVQLVQLVEAVLHGTAIPSTGAQGVSGGALDRVGVAFFTDIGSANTLALVVALGLVATPVAIARRLHVQVGRVVAATLALTIVVAALMAIASVIAVRARLHVYEVSNQAVTPAVRYSLASYLVSVFGPALVAFAGALAGLRWQRRGHRP
jgi:hypothetical protein